MKTRILGNTGLRVSEIGLGGWPLGGSEAGRGAYGPVPQRIAVETVRCYLDAGGNFIDTARAYGPSEEYIGAALQEAGCDRSAVIIASKSINTRSEEELPKIRKDLETSLRLLKTDYIDIYQIHAPPEEPTLRESVFDEFERFKGEGKIRFIGASIKGPAVTDDTVRLAGQYIATERVDVLQLIYSIYRQRNAEVFSQAASKGVGIIARTVLESGFLTGKYTPETIFDVGHRTRWSHQKTKQLIEVAQTITDFAVSPPYTSLAEVAIKYALSRPEVSTVIPGAKNTEQCRANTRVDTLPDLSPDLLSQLAEYETEEAANPD